MLSPALLFAYASQLGTSDWRGHFCKNLPTPFCKDVTARLIVRLILSDALPSILLRVQFGLASSRLALPLHSCASNRPYSVYSKHYSGDSYNVPHFSSMGHTLHLVILVYHRKTIFRSNF